MSKTWKDRLFDEMYTPYPTMDKVYDNTYQTQSEDIGMVHPTRGTGVLLRKDGNIETFADYGLGIRLDPTNNVLSVYASKIRVHSDSIEKVDYENQTYFKNEIAEIQGYVDKK